MSLIFDGDTFASHRPNSAFNTVAAEFESVGGFLFRHTDPVSGVVVVKAGQDVEMNPVDRSHDHFDVSFEEGLDKGVEGDLSLDGGEVDRSTLHKVFGTLVELVPLPFWRGILVVAFTVQTVMTGSETLGGTGEPCSVGVAHTVVEILVWNGHGEEL